MFSENELSFVDVRHVEVNDCDTLCLLRCRPCVRIQPAFNMLSNKYPQVVFLEVDVHVCQVSVARGSDSRHGNLGTILGVHQCPGIESHILSSHLSKATAAANNISATPTFLFFRNRVRVDQYQGADAAGLEEKIKQHVENDPGNNEDSDIPKGYVS